MTPTDRNQKTARIFRGKGRINRFERAEYHPDCIVLNQKSAWVDRSTILHMLREQLCPWRELAGHTDRDDVLLLCDSLDTSRVLAFHDASAEVAGTEHGKSNTEER